MPLELGSSPEQNDTFILQIIPFKARSEEQRPCFDHFWDQN